MLPDGASNVKKATSEPNDSLIVGEMAGYCQFVDDVLPIGYHINASAEWSENVVVHSMMDAGHKPRFCFGRARQFTSAPDRL